MWNPHLIVVTETWSKPCLDDSFFNIQEYNLYRRDRLICTGGGVFIYVHNSLVSAEILRDEISCFEDCVACKAKVPDGPSLVIAAFYRSPSSLSHNNLALTDAISKVMQYDSTYHILCGDFNFPDIDWTLYSSPPVWDFFLDNINEHNLVQFVKQPTRDKSILDLFFCDESGIVGKIEVREPLGNSDHNILSVYLNIPLILKNKAYKKALNYSKANWEMFSSVLLKQIDALYHKIVSSGGELSVEERWFLIKNAILDSAYQAIPVHYVKPFNRNCFLWRYPEIRNILNQKYKIYKKYKNSSDPKHKKIIRKNQSNTKKTIRRIKIEIENYIAESANSRPKIFWRHVRDRLKAPAVVPNIQKSDGSLSKDDYETACVLNDFFVSVFTAEPDACDSRFSRSFDCGSKLSTITVSPHDVDTVINRLKKDASPGPDGISNRFIIEGRTALSYVLADFFNYLLCKGNLPSDWKDANITPIHKSGSFAYPNNYRPISLTSSICKIFERIIHQKILSYLKENDLLAPSQHGFLPRKSCLTAHLECFEEITDLLDSGKPVDMIYIDFRKAFDSVPHKRLLTKLNQYGISGSLLDLISSFLTGRRQRVALRSEYSNWLPVKSGVPQGSVLGPLFFLLYINDIDNSLPNCIITKFADDIKIFSDVSDLSLQHAINNIVSWASSWLLEIHPDKCNVLHFGYNNHSINYWLDNTSINQVKHVKDLGIYVDVDLKWSQHCTRVARRAHRLLTIIKKSFTSRCPTIMLKLYKAQLLPIFDYLSPIWSPYLKRDVDALEKVQRRFTRFFSNIRQSPYRSRLSSLGLLSLESRRLRHDLITVFKIVHGFLDVSFEQFFTHSATSKTRGHCYKLYTHHVRLNCRRNFFTQRVITTWNALPERVVAGSSVSAFEDALTKYFVDNDIW